MRLPKTLTTAALAVALLALPAGALAKSRDRDHDHMADRWEKRHHLNVRANDARKDPDKDRLSNLSEFRHRTDPQKADTDDDRVEDGNELNDDTDPLDNDTDDDGVEDGNEISGTITSFNTPSGLLTIQPAAMGSAPISATVNSATKVECDDDADDNPTTTARASHDGSDDDNSGSRENSGPGSDSSGPGSGGSDDGAQHDVGDDNEDNCTTADLKPGVRVHEAELAKAMDGSMVFTEIELVPAA